MVYAQSTDTARVSPQSTAVTHPLFLNASQRENATFWASVPSLLSCPQEGSAATPRSNGSLSSYALSPGEVLPLGIALGTLWLVSVFGNTLVCLVIHRSRRTQSTTNYFVVSVACGDLLLSLGCAPFALLQVASGQWALGNGLCKVVRYLQYLSPGMQSYVLLSISLDRFYTIVYPLSFKVSREKAKKMILASWAFDAAFVSPCFIFYASSPHCNFFLPGTWDGILYGVVHLLFGFLLPIILILLFYQKVVKYIWRIGTDGRTVRRTMNIVPRTKVKTIKMFLLLNTVFLITWMPFYVAQLWHPNEDSSQQGASFFMAVTLVSFSSSAFKPTLYCVYNANFRRGMKETFCMSSMKCYRSNAYTITTSSRMARKNYVGIVEIPTLTRHRSVTKDSIYSTFCWFHVVACIMASCHPRAVYVCLSAVHDLCQLGRQIYAHAYTCISGREELGNSI